MPSESDQRAGAGAEPGAAPAASVAIRAASAADAAFLAGFAARLFRETFAADNRPEDMATFLRGTFSERRQAEELADPRVATIFAEVGDQVAGYAQLRAGHVPECVTTPDAIELARFYVDRVWHGRGVAQALMSAVEAEARARGAGSLWLGVWEHNARAQAFYRKLSFAPVGTHIFVLGTDEQTDVIMSRRLPSAEGDGPVV